MAKHSKSLFLFRRDLRLVDNTGLISALKDSQTVIPAFIFDPRQIGDNPYKGMHLVQFMLESLSDLNEDLKKQKSRLYFFYGQAEKVVENLIKTEGIEAVYVNRDYTPYSRNRDQAIAQSCQKIVFHSATDALLHEPQDIQKNDGTPYTVFTPFMRRCLQARVKKPDRFSGGEFFSSHIASEDKSIFAKLLKNLNPLAAVKGGRNEALKILKNMKSFKHYDDDRNIPSLNNTTHLSGHHKFGTCSIREVYHAICHQFGIEHALIREIYWRDFFTHIGFHFPHVLGGSFHKKYDALTWDNDPEKFKAWCEGRTGFPIVDAGMRELNTTGFMHNRVRMITASFLVKDLHIDWRWGEKYFAQQLLDYDPLVNNGNWQWAASTGCDAQPYFRIFNPWVQQEKFDPECLYIKKWIPELKVLIPKQIHKLASGQRNLGADYPAPIIDHKVESANALGRYEDLRKNVPLQA